MRTNATATMMYLLLTSGALFGQHVIEPLVLPASEDAQWTAPAIVDRHEAPALARLAATARPPRVEPFLLHEANIETVAQPIALAPAEMEGPAHPTAPRMLGKIVVDGASTLRIHVRDAAPGTVLWVAGSEDVDFERFEPAESATWGPTTNGSTVYVAASGEVGEASVTKLAVSTPEMTSNAASANACLRDAACTRGEEFPELEAASRAIALIRFVKGDASYICTGGLVNDNRNSRTPYLLTAHHCISTAEEAASIEAVWNLRAETCGSERPAAPVTRTYGATLLVSSKATDVALLRLNRVPPDRVYLGVDTRPLEEGTVTYRLSHPEGLMQQYTAGSVHAPAVFCPGAPPSSFIYVKRTIGTVTKGSSGAPLLLPGLRVAGQLLGACGPSPSDACAAYNNMVDGSLAASWPLLAPHLAPPQTTARRRAARP